jgi:hypothetical protein
MSKWNERDPKEWALQEVKATIESVLSSAERHNLAQVVNIGGSGRRSEFQRGADHDPQDRGKPFCVRFG